MDDRAFGLLKRKIAATLGIDLDGYKPGQMRRRLEAHVQRHARGDVLAFCRRLESDPEAREALRAMLTINVTEFFRDPPQFERLHTVILPRLLQEANRVNIWSAGCSHGAEPYSVAILLDDLGALGRSRILATDLDRDALQRARAGGPYNPTEVRNVRPAWLRTYFVRDGAGYRVVDGLRRLEIRELDLLSAPFERGFDLILCRNVMIYFSADVKTRLFQQFCAALRPGGVLFVGGTEALLGTDLLGFERLGGNFYRKARTAATGEQRVA
jgi:chemotaxis protein methyltransferase CheR